MLPRLRPLASVVVALPLLVVSCADDTASVADAGADAALDARLDVLADVAPEDSRRDGDAQQDISLDQGPADEGLPADQGPDTTPCVDPGVALGSAVRVSPSRLVAGQSVTVRYSGALASSASTVRLHYSFNNWSWTQPNGAPYATAKQVAMSPAGGGAWQVTVPIIAGAHQLDFVFTNQDASSWDNNNSEDWHRPIGGLWMGPYLTWRDNLVDKGADRDPARSVVVNFRSWRACKGRVRWGKTPAAFPHHVDDAQAGRDHHLRITGLSPNTVYHYQLGCLDTSVACSFLDRSPTFRFRTAPAGTAAPLKVLVLADPQDNDHIEDRWQDIAKAVAKAPHDDAVAVIIAGDLAGDDEPERWRTFFRKGAPLLATKVLVPVVGNHDTPTYGSVGTSKTFEELFDLDSSSGKDTYYGVQVGALTVLALNSETAQPWVTSSDWDAPNGAQYSWLSQRLAQLSSPWTFATWHISPFDVGVRHADQNDSTRTVLPLLDKKVDWVFSGHEHLYQRLKPLRYTGMSGGKPRADVAPSYGRGAADGVGYLLAPPAGHYPAEDELLPVGNPLRGMLASPGASELNGDKLKASWVGFSVVTLVGKTFKLETFELGKSQPRDSVTYSKP